MPAVDAALDATAGFLAALNASPAGWRLWVMGLVLMNLLVPLLFLGRREARVVIAVFLIQGAFMALLYGLQGFTRLLGLAHLGWIGLAWYLWKRIAQAGPDAPFGIWLRLLLAVDTVSLSIDVVDVIRYALGQRSPLR